MNLTGRWREIFEQESKKEYFLKLKEKIKNDREHGNVFPEPADVLNALKYCPFEKTKVVILGQDPYHTTGHAHGFAFSSKANMNNPPSLQVIFDELIRSYIEAPWTGHGCGNLTKWAIQGVLLLNTILTVQEGKALSHANIGWEQFTGVIIDELLNKDHIVWLLWGTHAKAALSGKKTLKGGHKMLLSHHPQAQNYNKNNAFVGNNHFYKCNQQLIEWGYAPIHWDTDMDSPIKFKDWQDYLEWKEQNNAELFWFELPKQRFNYDRNGKAIRKDLITYPI